MQRYILAYPRKLSANSTGLSSCVQYATTLGVVTSQRELKFN